MSRLLDATPRLFGGKKTEAEIKIATSVIEVLGDDLTSMASIDDMDKYAIMNERGTARNLDRVNISNSIYSEDKDASNTFALLDFLFW